MSKIFINSNEYDFSYELEKDEKKFLNTISKFGKETFNNLVFVDITDNHHAFEREYLKKAKNADKGEYYSQEYYTQIEHPSGEVEYIDLRYIFMYAYPEKRIVAVFEKV